MRKITFLVLSLMFVVLPTFAQNDGTQTNTQTQTQTRTQTPTLYDLIAQDDDFSFFLQAIAQDGTLAPLLQNPDVLLTVVVPDNRGITETLAAVGLTYDDLLSDATVLNNVLRHHIIPAVFTYSALQERNLTYMMTLLEERGLLVQSQADAVFLNTVPVIGNGRRAANGQFLRVEQLLIPPQRLFIPDEPSAALGVTLADYIAQNPNFSIFNAMLEQFPAIQTQLTFNGPYTVFAPTDAIIEADLAAAGWSTDELLNETALLRTFLTRHILPGHVVSGTIEAILPLMGDVDFRLLSLGWYPLTFTAQGDYVLVENARIIATDVLLTNGVIHIIDSVIGGSQPAGQDI